jgi:hypothetical protein
LSTSSEETYKQLFAVKEISNNNRSFQGNS